jgi:anion-transporting  ArsA/GET3 family ATPase
MRWPARLHVVTGKGGTGKTTVAAALALALASDGRRTLLIEVEERQGIAGIFDRAPLPYAERPVAVGYPGSAAEGGGEVFALAVDPEEALLEYLDMFYRLGRAGKALKRLGAIDFATTVAPGVRDVLLTGKVKEAVTRTENGRRVYDAVVLDAPPTGRIGRFLNVTAETARITKVGPIKNQSIGVAAVLRSPVTSVHVVALLEEMPVQETADAIAELHRLDLPVGNIIINATQAPLLPKGKVAQAEVRRGLVAAGLPAGRDAVAGLVDEARAYLMRGGVEEELRGELAAIGRPIVELPALPTGVSQEGLYTLAGLLLAGPTAGTASSRGTAALRPARKASEARRGKSARPPVGAADEPDATEAG